MFMMLRLGHNLVRRFARDLGDQSSPPPLAAVGVIACCVTFPGRTGFGGEHLGAGRVVAEHASDDRRWGLDEQVPDGAGASVEVGDAEAGYGVEPLAACAKTAGGSTAVTCRSAAS